MEGTSAFVSSGDSGKQQSLAEYEKDYLERLQKPKEGQDLQDLIFNFSKDLKKPEVVKVANVDYVGHCTFCMMGVPRKEMIYKNSQLFHSNCFEQQGKNFPAPNLEFIVQNSKVKVELVQLKNLKIRKMGSSNSDSIKPKTKTKKKTKKRRPKRRVIKRKRTSTKRKKTKRRRAAKRRSTKRRTAPKRKKSTRKTKRRVTRRVKRKTRRRR